MKRANNTSLALAESVVPELHQELWCEVASHMRLENVAQIYQWILIGNRMTLRALPFALKCWANLINNPFKSGPKKTLNQYYVMVDLLHKNGVKHGVLVDFLARQNRLPDPTPQLVALFDLQKQALMDKHMLLCRHKSKRLGLRVGDFVVNRVSRFSTTPIGSVFYSDMESVAIPLKRLPGLRTVSAPKKTSVIWKQSLALLKERSKKSGALTDRLALAAVKRLSSNALRVRSIHYELQKLNNTPLRTHKPHKKSLLRDVVINGRHLFSDESESRQLLPKLFTCFHNKPAKKKETLAYADDCVIVQKPYPHCPPQEIVLQAVTARARFLATLERMKIVHPSDAFDPGEPLYYTPQFPSVSDSDSDTDSD